MLQRADDGDVTVGEFELGRLGAFEAGAFRHALILPDQILNASNGCWFGLLTHI